MQKEESVIEGFELSPQQRRAWELRETGGGLPYHAQCLVEIDGALDAGALRRAVRDVAARHEILRTTFRRQPGADAPVQLVTDDEAEELPRIDLTGLSADQQDRRLSEWLEAARAPADAGARVSPLRSALFALAGHRHALTLSLPALCADRAALENLVAEIARGYESALRGEAPSHDGASEGEPLQYADLAAWQNELAVAEESEPGRAYWRESALPETGATQLPLVGRRAPAARFNPRVLNTTVGPQSYARINALASRHDTPVRNVLLACWQLLLWRLTGLPEIIVGVHFGGRKYDELKDAVGPLARYLPVRCRADHGLRFDDLLGRTTEAAAAAARWQECFSWELIGGTAAAGRRDDTPPFAPVCFDFAVEPATRTAGGATFTIRRQYECADRFQVKLACRLGGDALHAELHYDASVLGAGDAGRLAEEFHTLLSSVAASPESRLAEFEIVGESERRLLLHEFNETRADLAVETTLHRLFEQQAARTPASVAVEFEDGRLTYAELNARANQLAHYLKTIGVGPDVPVGLCLERSPEMIVGLLGVLKAGGAYVPLDPDYPQERLAFMAEDAAFPVLLTQQRLLAQLAGQEGHAVHPRERDIKIVCLDTQWDVVADQSRENPADGVSPDNLAYVIYTSGSTGLPKGAMLAHRGVVNRLLWMQQEYGLTADDRVLQKTPFSFDVSVWEFFWPLLAGARLIFARPGGHQDSQYLVSLIRGRGVTALHFVPSMLHAFLLAGGVEGCESLRLVVCSGEALPFELQERFFARLGARLDNLYGPTEASVDVTYWECQRGGGETAVPIGRPVANTQIYVLDKNLNPVPVGAAGELHLGGVQLARGYLNRPGLTAERFIPDPFGGEVGGRLYKTGDVARYRADGNVEYLGRLDQQVKLRGFRIELGEVEAALAAHPSVREAVVLLREEQPGDPRLVAYVVAEGGAAVAVEELRRVAGERLPEYMIPSAFVTLDSLPLSPNGKLERRALPPPTADGARDAQPFVAPRDNVEVELARVWEEILNVRPVGVRDNFFELGGHSLLALRVISQIHSRFGKELPLAAMIQAGTIENLAQMVREEPRLLSWDPLVAIQPAGTKPPFFAVHSIGGQVFCYVALARHLGDDQPFYGLQAPRLESVGDSQVSVEEMAAHYLKTVRDVQPEGPYLLGGYSYGSMVAFEMARQLRQQGQEVALLALLDSRSPTDFNKLPVYEEDDAFMLALRGKVAAYEQGRTINMTTEEFRGLDYEQQLAHFLRRMHDEKLLPPEHDLTYLRNFMQGYKARQKAMRFYDPTPYPGRATLFRASENDPWLLEQFAAAGVDIDDPTAGWGGLTTEPVETYDVPGNHDRICYEPHVRVLAKHLRHAIEKAMNGGDAQSQASGARGWATKLWRKG
jgi:amino acid adenylation domain-containing protein